VSDCFYIIQKGEVRLEKKNQKLIKINYFSSSFVSKIEKTPLLVG
jgi:hypothetical protein